MKIYNQDKTQELNKNDIDLDKGYLVPDVLITHVPAVEAVKEEGHYETIAEYPGGGKDTKWIVDIPAVEGKEAYDITENIDVYILYTDEELHIHNLQRELVEYKQLLNTTDYQAIKYAEGYYTDEEYAQIKQTREGYREKVRSITSELEELTL